MIFVSLPSAHSCCAPLVHSLDSIRRYHQAAELAHSRVATVQGILQHNPLPPDLYCWQARHAVDLAATQAVGCGRAAADGCCHFIESNQDRWSAAGIGFRVRLCCIILTCFLRLVEAARTVETRPSKRPFALRECLFREPSTGSPYRRSASGVRLPIAEPATPATARSRSGTRRAGPRSRSCLAVVGEAARSGHLRTDATSRRERECAGRMLAASRCR